MKYDITRVVLSSEQDVVLARHRVRHLAELIGFTGQDQVRLATATSEIARNAFRYGRGGVVRLTVEGQIGQQFLSIEVADEGPGIPHLADVLAGRYESRTGMGPGIVGARRLIPRFEIESRSTGTRVNMLQPLPHSAQPVDAQLVNQITQKLAQQTPGMNEFHAQNQELLRAFAELQERQAELQQLNAELQDTNRGVVALYAELDDRAEQLRRANQLRAQFMSYMGHEFRTPLDSMIALSGLLLARLDGELSPEQDKQVQLIRRSARDLLTMVDDLLDSARAEAGQIAIRPTSFLATDLFNALRATLRPLLTSEDVLLVFEEATHVPSFYTDEGRLSQIMRNLISNALKFTPRGEVRVAARTDFSGENAIFTVADTGIGIPADSIEAIFQDFTQVETALQRRRKGTGLGLPLSRKLAELLGGTLLATSKPGAGSTFTVTIPLQYCAPSDIAGARPLVAADSGFAG